MSPSPDTRRCSIVGCDATDYYAKGMCSRHYHQDLRSKKPRFPRRVYTKELGICLAEGCENQFLLRASGSKRRFCSRRCADRTLKSEMRKSHNYVPPKDRVGGRRCCVGGCGKPHSAHGYCVMHAERVRKYGDPHFVKHDRRPGEWRSSRDGYLYRFTNGEKQLQHRIVMEDHLARMLWPDETVHHLNGDRSDNRIENLELWSKWQPSGQRVEDKIAYARELLARYCPDEYPPP